MRYKLLQLFEIGRNIQIQYMTVKRQPHIIYMFMIFKKFSFETQGP